VRQTDRPTDHATRSVTIGRIYVRSTAMWSNNADITRRVVFRVQFCAVEPYMAVESVWQFTSRSFQHGDFLIS